MTVAQRLREAVVDSSAIMSIFEGRPSSGAFKTGLQLCDKLYMSAGTMLELSILLISRKDVAGFPLLDSLLACYRVSIIPFDESALASARLGCLCYGKRRHKAALNYGDLFAYSLAKARGLPLYFEGLDFTETDLGDAMQLLGYGFDQQHGPVARE